MTESIKIKFIERAYFVYIANVNYFTFSINKKSYQIYFLM